MLFWFPKNKNGRINLCFFIAKIRIIEMGAIISIHKISYIAKGPIHCSNFSLSYPLFYSSRPSTLPEGNFYGLSNFDS